MNSTAKLNHIAPGDEVYLKFGHRVHLRSCPFGVPGTVEKLWRGRVIVHWPGWNCTSKHRPYALMLADDQECPPLAQI